MDKNLQDDEELAPIEREFLMFAREMPEADRQALLRAMEYINANPMKEPLTQEKIAELVEQMKRMH